MCDSFDTPISIFLWTLTDLFQNLTWNSGVPYFALQPRLPLVALFLSAPVPLQPGLLKLKLFQLEWMFLQLLLLKVDLIHICPLT